MFKNKRKYAKETIIEGDLKLNTVTGTLYVKDKEVVCTTKEFELLKFMIENKGVTLKKEYLFDTIWGSDSESEIQTVTVHIKWLREKIEYEVSRERRFFLSEKQYRWYFGKRSWTFHSKTTDAKNGWGSVCTGGWRCFQSDNCCS